MVLKKICSLDSFQTGIETQIKFIQEATSQVLQEQGVNKTHFCLLQKQSNKYTTVELCVL